MKKLSIILILIIVGSCNIGSKGVKLISAFDEKGNEINTAKPSQQFQSSDLDTITPYKKKTKVALFFPMTGKYKSLGQSLFNSAVLSLFENDINENLELILIDSKESPLEAKEQFKKIIDQEIGRAHVWTPVTL